MKIDEGQNPFIERLKLVNANPVSPAQRSAVLSEVDSFSIKTVYESVGESHSGNPPPLLFETVIEYGRPEKRARLPLRWRSVGWAAALVDHRAACLYARGVRAA